MPVNPPPPGSDSNKERRGSSGDVVSNLATQCTVDNEIRKADLFKQTSVWPTKSGAAAEPARDFGPPTDPILPIPTSVARAHSAKVPACLRFRRALTPHCIECIRGSTNQSRKLFFCRSVFFHFFRNRILFLHCGPKFVSTTVE